MFALSRLSIWAAVGGLVILDALVFPRVPTSSPSMSGRSVLTRQSSRRLDRASDGAHRQPRPEVAQNRVRRLRRHSKIFRRQPRYRRSCRIGFHATALKSLPEIL